MHHAQGGARGVTCCVKNKFSSRSISNCAAAVLLSALALTRIAAAQTPNPNFRVRFHTANGLILLDGQLNGKPATFLLDTGTTDSVMDCRAAGFSSLKLAALPPSDIVGSEGSYAIHELRLALGHLTWICHVFIMDRSGVSKKLKPTIKA